jgi:D-glycero-D-manno-heptose 1,7-bisphosphate phosphatase
MQRAIFLDKDGTLIEDLPYNVDPARITLCRQAGAGLRLLRDAGYQFHVISNQSGVALGHFAESALLEVQQALCSLLAAEGIDLRACYWCPHGPEDGCGCRKPRPGMLQRAAREHGIDLPASWMVGDILNDVEAGQRAGCRSVLIDNGNETEWKSGPLRQPHAVAGDLLQAARAILLYARHDVENREEAI